MASVHVIRITEQNTKNIQFGRGVQSDEAFTGIMKVFVWSSLTRRRLWQQLQKRKYSVDEALNVS